jgi:hypothetical protein
MKSYFGILPNSDNCEVSIDKYPLKEYIEKTPERYGRSQGFTIEA